MDLTVGAILEGKVKTITSFGAFIALPEGKTGMVHISEVANAYVSDIHQHLTEGQDVKVMVIAVDPAGKINLSIKRLEPKPEGGRRNSDRNRSGNSRPNSSRDDSGSRTSSRHTAPVPTQATVGKSGDQSFEEKLKQFMSESDSKISSIRQYSDHRTKSRRR